MDLPPSDPVVFILIFVCFLLLDAFFSAGESAITLLNDKKLTKESEKGDKRAGCILGMFPTRPSFPATLQTGRTLSEIAMAVLFADRYIQIFSDSFSSIGISTRFALMLAVISSILIALLISTTVGKLIPGMIAANNPEKIAYTICYPLALFYKLFSPISALLLKFSEFFVKIFGVNPSETRDVTEEHILLMVDAGNEKGNIEQSEKDMINNIFDLDNKTAAEVMTHRTEIEAVDLKMNINSLVSFVINTGYSRIPVFENDIDHIVGIIYVKDLLPLIGCKTVDDFVIKDFIRKPYFVPESNTARELFAVFSEKKLSFAVVVDEYGGTSGIVTMEDLLECIVGSIQDEYDDEEECIKKDSDNSFTIDGTATLDEVAKLLGIEFADDYDCDTLGGLIINSLGKIPEAHENTSITIANVEFTVLSVEERRINKVHAKQKIASPANQKT